MADKSIDARPDSDWQKTIKRYHRRIQTAWTQQKWDNVINIAAEFKRYCQRNVALGGLGEPDDWPWYKNMFEDAQQKKGVNFQKVILWDDIR